MIFTRVASLSRQIKAYRSAACQRKPPAEDLYSPSGVAVSFRRPELEGARLVGPCWCSGDLMEEMIICWRAAAGLLGVLTSLYCSAADGGVF